MKNLNPINKFLGIILLSSLIFSCTKDRTPEKENQIALTKKNEAVANVKKFSTFLNKKGNASIKVNSFSQLHENYGLEYMEESYGDEGVEAYQVPSQQFQTYYTPTYATSAVDIQNDSPATLSTKIHTDLNSFFDIDDLYSSSNASSGVKNSLNNLSTSLKNIAGNEMDSYIFNLVDTSNFDENVLFEAIKSKTDLALGSYMSNLGNSFSISGQDQIQLLVAASYAQESINSFDFRNNGEIAATFSVNSTKQNAVIKTYGFFNKLGKVLLRVAKVVVAVVVSAVVIVGSAAIAYFVGELAIPGLGGVDALAGALYGFDRIYRSNLWNWAVNS